MGKRIWLKLQSAVYHPPAVMVRSLFQCLFVALMIKSWLLNIRYDVRDLFSLQKAASAAELHITFSGCSSFVRSNRWKAKRRHQAQTIHNINADQESCRWNCLGLVLISSPASGNIQCAWDNILSGKQHHFR